ncbi:cell division protein FtsQ [Burkholderia multivorans]|nr:cell division protein FtsQ [Burkholderia multivorans]
MKNRFNRRHRLPLGEHESSAWRRDRARRVLAGASAPLSPTHPRAPRQVARDAAPRHAHEGGRRSGCFKISASTYPSLTRRPALGAPPAATLQS